MPPQLERASVLGAGAMGTLCALQLAGRGVRTTLWARRPDFADDLANDRENRRYLPGPVFPAELKPTADAGRALADPQLIVSAIPCQYMRAVWEDVALTRAIDAPVVSVTKGIEVRTLKRATQILADLLIDARLCALSGPCLAAEAAAGLPTAVVVAAEDLNVANFVQEAFSTATFRVYTNTDLIGVELGGAAKNVIGLAAGACDGLNLGHNAKASLLTRGLVEITRLGTAMGAHADTFKGLAGIGDLIATCNSTDSRNHEAGARIGRGYPLEEVIDKAHGVVEGIETTRSLLQLAARHRVAMPITEAVHSVLFEHQSPRSAIDALMTRTLKEE